MFEIKSLMSELLVLLTILLGGAFDTDVSERPPSEGVFAEVVRVVDGDTIDVLLDGEKVRVRYVGIDTPEPYSEAKPECYSKEASDANRRLVEGKTVELVSDVEDKDQYDRLLRYVYADEVFVNKELVRDGFATTLPIRPNTAHASEFRSLELEAKEKDLGLWGACH
jgi:micrococcal nuclease